MAKPGDPKPESSNGFEPVETTEVIPLENLVKSVPPKPAEPAPEPAPEPESPDKKYVAPTQIPLQTVPDHVEDAPKIVLNIPEPKTDKATVAEARARRRAPTVKIARGALGFSGGIVPVQPIDDAPDGGIDVTLDDEVPPAVEPPPPLAVLAAPLDARSEHPRVVLPSAEPSEERRRSRAWLALPVGLLVVGGVGAALVLSGQVALPEALGVVGAKPAASAPASASGPRLSAEPGPATSSATPPSVSAEPVPSALPSASATESAPTASAPTASAPPLPTPTWRPPGGPARPWPPPRPTQPPPPATSKMPTTI